MVLKTGIVFIISRKAELRRMDNAPKAKNAPAHKERLGAVSVVAWENTMNVQGREVTTFNVKLSRSYKDRNNNWAESDSLRMNDIPKAIEALREMYLWLCRGAGGKQVATSQSEEIAGAYL